MNLKVIQSRKDELLEEARKVLNSGIDMEFESVILIGFKDGLVHITSSKSDNYLERLGALAQAQHTLLKGE